MNIPSSHPRSKRPNSAKSASTHISFPASPRNSPRSKTSYATNQGTYSDYDIIKSRSWSGSKLRSNTPVRNSASEGAKQPIRRSVLVSPAQPRSALVSPAQQRSTVATPIASASRGLTTPRRAIASGGSAASVSTKGSALQSKGSQVERLQQEWAYLEHCRAMKRSSEIVQHRLDPMYRLSGSPVPLLHRYHVNDVELQKLRDMAETSRLLQHDLKRIKFPHTGPRTPRKERNKSKGRSQQRDAANAEDAAESNNNATNGEGAEQQANDMETSPGLEYNPDAVHPSSPVSTPEPTPRPQGNNVDATSQASGQQGEIIQDTAEQGEANGDEGEVNTAGEEDEEEELGGDETQERTELDDA